MRSTFYIFLTKHCDAVLASLVASAFIYFYTRHSGIGISPDSVNYESVATNIRNHFSFTDFNGQPLVDFPLGYPSFLALISRLSGSAVLAVAPALNCILFSGVIILASVIIEGYKQITPVYKACLLALIACSPCLLEVYSMLWSETLFLFLVLLFVVALRNYFRTYHTSGLLLVAIVVALAFVTRYAGATLLATGIFMLLFNGEINTSKKIKHLFVFILTGSSLVILNLIRNSYAAGHITGVREKAIRTLGDNLRQIGITVSDWLPFLKGHETTTTIIFLILLSAAIVILVYRLLQQQFFAFYETIIACFFVTYTFFIVIIATISRFEDLTGRLLSPLYIPLLLVTGSIVIGIVQRTNSTKRILAVIIVLIIYAAFHYNHYHLNAEAWEGIKDAGIPGYTEDPWTQSPAVDFVKKNKAQFTPPVYANANDAVYFLTGIHAIALPHKEIQKEIDAFLRQPSFYLIWFTDGDNPDLVNLDFIRQHKKQASVNELEGGSVYFFF